MKLRKDIKKILIISVLVILPFVMEFFVSNFSVSFLHKEDKGILEIQPADINKKKYELEGKEYVEFEVRGIDKYVNKLEINLTEESEKNFAIKLDVLNDFGTPEEKDRNISLTEFNEKTTQFIDKEVSAIKIISPKENFGIESLKIINVASFNSYRFLFFAFISVFIGSFLLLKHTGKFKLERIFLILSLSIGIIFIVGFPKVSLWTPDSQIHYDYSYKQSFLGPNASLTTSYDLAIKLPAISIPNTMQDNKGLGKILDQPEHNNPLGYMQKRVVTTYNQWGYSISSIGIKIGRLFGLPHTMQFSLGKIFNLLFYAILGFFAIKYAKKGKRLMFVLATLPTPLFFAAQYSLDGIIYSCVLFAMSLFIRQYLEKDRKISFLWSLGFVSSICFASFCKAVYAPLILLPLLFNNEKFLSEKQRKLFKSGVIAIFVLLMISMFLPMMLNSAAPGDTRGGVTSATGQLSSILSHPLAFTEMFSNIILNSVSADLLSFETTSYFYYLGHVKSIYSFVILILMIYLSFTDWDLKEKIPTYHKIFIGCIIAMIVCMVYGAMYLSFTPIGMSTINGVQPRYFAPLIPILLFIPASTTIKNKNNSNVLSSVTVFIMATLLFLIAYEIVVLMFCN